MKFCLIIFTLLISLNKTFAGYLILDKTRDNPVCDSDENSTVLYDILLRNEWPSSLSYHGRTDPDSSYLNEKDRIEKELNQVDLKSKVSFVWIPDSLYELFLANFFLEHHEKYFAPSPEDENSPPKLGFGIRDSFLALSEHLAVADCYVDLADSNSYLDEILKLHHLDLKKTQKALQEKQDQLNQKVKSVFFEANQALFIFLKSADLPDLVKDSDPSVEWRISLQKLRSLLVKEFYTQFRGKGGQQLRSKHYFGRTHDYLKPAIPEAERVYLLGEMSFIDWVVLSEVDAYQKNQGLLYRGTNGFGSYIDHASHGLSYGASLFAGLFKDSPKLKPACAYQFMVKNSIAYLLRIDKNSHSNSDSLTKELFFIPPLNSITRLMSSYEFFHPRSKVGGSPSAELYGVENCHPELGKTGLLSTNKTSEIEQMNLIDSYIGEHSIILPLSLGKLTSEERTQKLLKSHRETVESVIHPSLP